MWEHPAVTENLATLRRRGVYVVEPESGRLAGGDVGSGRLADPATIAAAVIECCPATRSAIEVASGIWPESRPWSRREGRANPSTRCDSSATAHRASRVTRWRPSWPGVAPRVTLVSTATATMPSPIGTEVVGVETAAEMAAAVLSRSPAADVVVMAAAVADFTPKAARRRRSSRRPTVLRRSSSSPPRTSSPASAPSRRPGQVLVGFAAETAAPEPGR